MKSTFKNLIKNNKQVFLLLLFAVQTLGYFMSDFFGLDYHTVHIALDDKVPYLPVFIIPYILWYAYIPLPMIIACFKDKERFYRQAWTVFTGALMCTVFFYIFPTKIDFRPVRLLALSYNLFERYTDECFPESALLSGYGNTFVNV